VQIPLNGEAIQEELTTRRPRHNGTKAVAHHSKKAS